MDVLISSEDFRMDDKLSDIAIEVSDCFSIILIKDGRIVSVIISGTGGDGGLGIVVKRGWIDN